MLTNIIVRPIREEEEMPYGLLLDADPAMEVIESYLKISEVYVALLDNVVIGVFVLCAINATTVELKNIAITTSYQGQGIGSLLLSRVIEIADTKGMETVVVGTSNASILELKFYQKNGFDIINIKRNFIVDNYPRPIFDNGIQCRHMIMLAKAVRSL